MGPKYWRSLDELAGTSEFRQWLDAEFPHVPPEFVDGPTRRQFLKLMGASLAFAGLTGCRWPRETIVPATRRPPHRVPGETVQYATAMELGGVGTGLLVTSYDGRPIKIEGNVKHPYSRGKTNHWMQASILDLYDPDRSMRPMQRVEGGRKAQTWNDFDAWWRARPTPADGGRGLAVLSEASSAPTLTAFRQRLSTTYPQARWFEFEPLAPLNARAGSEMAFGGRYRTHLHLDKADVIVSLGSDFLMLHPAALKHARDFAAGRKADDGRMNRLYAIESNVSVTGSMADHRWALRPSQLGTVLRQLILEVNQRLPERAAITPVAPEGLPISHAELVALADDLVKHAGHCVIVTGPYAPPDVHAAVHQLNEQLNNVGKTVTYTEEAAPGDTLERLAKAIDAGAIETLVVLGGNPVYAAPADVGIADKLSKVPTSLHLSLYDNETSHACTWHLPRAHYLEAWGDTRAWDGTVSLVQPLIQPLYDGRTPCELLAQVLNETERDGYALTRRTFREQFAQGAADWEERWQQALHDGVVPDTTWPTRTPTVTGAISVMEKPAESGRELLLLPDYSVYDGRFANNGWLQEWPDPITKLTWDNAALLAPSDAAELGLAKNGDMVRLEHAGSTLTVPVYILPGHAAGVVTLSLGYGRGRDAGLVADGAGFNAYALRTTTSPTALTGVVVRSAGAHYKLVGTQDHHAIQSPVGDEATQARIPILIREATLAHYQHHPEFARHLVHHLPLKSLWQEPEFDGHRWGMSIDLSTCIGCSACVLACQAENNIPVVGKDEVAMGREMHWIRIDRYFKEAHEQQDTHNLAKVELVHQPVTCVQCENAPCEQVCPVAATVHDTEGLNNMVYNRCVGTRYCSNNCPFKVRRFNWFYNHHGPFHPRSLKADAVSTTGGVNILPLEYKKQPVTPVEKLRYNPDVTVRSRGVMEKCTFCVQRIMQARITAKNEGWDRIPDGLITPACAQACPTDAIVFGDLNDPESRVRQLHEHNRAYALLAELNIQPRLLYMAKLRNPATDNHGEKAVEHH